MLNSKSEENVEFKVGANHRGKTLIDPALGAVNGFRLGVSCYTWDVYGEPGVHDDQEGFYVLEGTGMARIGEREFPIAPGTVFLAPKGVPHSIRKDPSVPHVKVLWAHGAVYADG